MGAPASVSRRLACAGAGEAVELGPGNWGALQVALSGGDAGRAPGAPGRLA